MLVRYIRACCPQQAIDEFTPDAWHDILGHLDAAAVRQAVMAVLRRQPFVAPAEIIAELRHHPSDRPYPDAFAIAAGRELGSATPTPPTVEYLVAKADLEEKLAQRKAEMEAEPELPPIAISQRAQLAARRWIGRKLAGRLPPEPPDHGAPPAPRWGQLPDDPPELREWLIRQDQDDNPGSSS